MEIRVGYGRYKNAYDDGVGEVSLNKFDYIIRGSTAEMLGESFENMIDFKVDKEIASQRIESEYRRTHCTRKGKK